MAEVSYLNLHGDVDGNDDVLVSFPNRSQDLDGFDVYPSDLDFPPSHDLIYRRRRPSPDRDNRVNFLIDMLHQSHLVVAESDLVDSDRSFGVIEANQEMNPNDLDLDFGSELELGLGLGFPVEACNCNDDCDDKSGFMVADCGDEFFVSESGYSSGPECYVSGLRVIDLGSDSDDAIENEDDDFGMNGGCDDFQLEDDNLRGDDTANEDFEWEEVEGGVDEREVLSMFFDGEADDDASVLPLIPPELGEEQRADVLDWEVLLNVRSLEPNLDSEDQDDEYNYAEHEMFFGQFADNDHSSLVRPPASKRVVECLLSVEITRTDVENNNTHCAVCKDEIGVGETAKELPCTHRYHGDCIVPWLGIRNTCPVCRHELPTDDPDYERRKAERVAGAD